MGKGGKGGGSEAKQARQDEEKRQKKVRQGTAKINSIFDGQFNDDFYRNRRDSYATYATPQLDTQYSDANKELTYSLARSGLLDSSTRGEKASELQKLYDLQKQKVSDDALSYETDARGKVEGARGDLISMVNTTADAEGAAASALNRSAALSQGPSFSPLGQLFEGFTSALGTQAAAEKSYAYSDGPKPRFSLGLFGPPKNSVKNNP